MDKSNLFSEFAIVYIDIQGKETMGINLLSPVSDHGR